MTEPKFPFLEEEQDIPASLREKLGGSQDFDFFTMSFQEGADCSMHLQDANGVVGSWNG